MIDITMEPKGRPRKIAYDDLMAKLPLCACEPTRVVAKVEGQVEDPHGAAPRSAISRSKAANCRPSC